MPRRHLGLAVLLAIAAPLIFAFCHHRVVASLGDDSVSYLVLARFLSPFASDPLTAPWAGYSSHFPPLFPLLLAFTGGAQDFLVAHLAVAACAVVALAMVYAYGALRFESAAAALLLAISFLLLPTAWISVNGILSEPLYLALSLGALVYHERRVEKNGSGPSYVLFGLLLASAYLTRVAGIALLAAYTAHGVAGAISRRKLPSPKEFLPILIALALQGLWIGLRPPLQSNGYEVDLRTILDHWVADPGHVASISWNSLWGGWISSFTAHSDAPPAMRIVFGLAGILGIAGAVCGARRNRLDSWYVLASLAMLFLWVFNEDNQRRLLYPIVPLLLVHAAEALVGGVARFPARVRLAMLGTMLLVPLLSVPASLLVLERSSDRAPLVPGFEYSAATMTEFYTTSSPAQANALAFQHAAVLAGLQSLEKATPAGSRVMWMRPEYVALLGRREGVPWYFSWDRATLAREIRRTGTTHLVVTRLFKSDLAGRGGDAFAAIAIDTPGYLRLSMLIRSPGSGAEEFVLLEVDRAALD